MAEKEKLTYEEFIEMADKLRRMNGELTEMYPRIYNSGDPREETAKLMYKAMQSVSAVRARLEDKMYREMPHCADYKLFYGAQARDKKDG